MHYARYPNLNRLPYYALAGFFLSGCIGGGGSSGNPVLDMTPAFARSYELVFSDEFDGAGGPDPAKWNIETGYGPNNDGWGNDESQLYTGLSDNVRVEGGDLVITARCDLAVSGVCGKRDGSITSARITTKDKFEFRYGKVEARIKVPSGSSTWPAFWMLGAGIPDIVWPASGEIDIMEVHQDKSDINTTHSAAHWYDGGWQQFSQGRRFNAPLSDDYHVWALEWDERHFTASIDGISYFTKVIDPVVQREFLKSFFLILNIAIDGTLGGPPNQIISTPQEMRVDWVRVYQRPAAGEEHLLGDAPGSESLPYLDIINSADLGGNSVTANIASRDVPPLEGENVLRLDFFGTAAPSSGAIFSFASADVSCHTHLSLAVDSLLIPNFNDLSIELADRRNAGGIDTTGKAAVSLSSYAPTSVGNWRIYDIPLVDFSGVDLDDIARLGFWNPVDGVGSLLNGTLFLDDIFFSGAGASCYGGDGQNLFAASGPELLVNGSFELDTYKWIGTGGGIRVVNDNGWLVNHVNVAAAGNPWDVNLSQIVTLVPGTSYTFSFRARGTPGRTLIAGLGLNHAPWSASTQVFTLGSTWQTYTMTVVPGFGDANSRVLFDMGADVGDVYIDEVSLTSP